MSSSTTRIHAALALSVLLGACFETDAHPAGTAPEQPERPGEGGAGGRCGDGTCDPSESCGSCEADCGACPACDEGGGGADGDVVPVEYAAEIQPIFDQHCTRCHDPGGDAGLDLTSFAGASTVITPCGCEGSLLYQKTGPNPPYGDRMPRDGPPYLSDADRALLCAWIDQGAGQSHDPEACTGGGAEECSGTCGDDLCDVTESCMACPDDCGPCGDGTDTTPPIFAGVADVTEPDDSACHVFWQPASDDVSAAAALRYLVYVTEEDGAFAFDAPIAEATSVLDLVVEPPLGTRYDVLVRAQDEAGNTDGNTVRERCDLR